MTETQLIEKIRRWMGSNSKNLRVGIGDDCSVIAVGKKEIVVTCDALVEGVHFKRNWASWKQWGIKAAGAAISDIAAMGATPRFGWIQLSLPKNFKEKEIKNFYLGLKKVFKKFKVTLAGGNISRSPKGFAATLMIWGERPKGLKMLRSDAKVGDRVYIAGALGWAGRGLGLLKRGLKGKKFIDAFLNPKPQIALGQWLAKNKIANACIDVSDGLLKDLDHIAKASKVKIVLNKVEKSFTSGEDYILAFTAPPSKTKRLAKKKNIVRIGSVQKGPAGVWPKLFVKQGYEHF